MRPLRCDAPGRPHAPGRAHTSHGTDATRRSATRRLVPVLVATALLGAVASPAAAQLGELPVPPSPPPGDPGPHDVRVAELVPLPAADAVTVSDEALALRRELLGDEALRDDTVSLHWVGVSSFVATLGSHVLLFDAWEIVGMHRDVLPIGREELAALEPEAILLGHGHFDHAADVGFVAGTTGATVVGGQEICDRVREDARYDEVADDFPCVVLGTDTSPAPGTVQELALFADLPPLQVVTNVHSEVRPPGDGNELAPLVPIFDPRPYLTLNLDPAELARFVRSLDAPRGGTWMYHATVGDLTVLWGNSSGPLDEHPAVAEALASLPGCVDVMTNALLGFGQIVSGLQDPRLYLEAVQPRIFLPTHGDAWAPVISAGQAQYVRPFQAQLARMDDPPEVDFLLDPHDYLEGRIYAVDDPLWRDPPPGSRCATAAAAQRVAGDVDPEVAAEPDGTSDETAGDEVAARPLPVTGGGAWLLGAALLAAATIARRR